MNIFFRWVICPILATSFFVPPGFTEVREPLRKARVYVEAGRSNDAAQLMRDFEPRGSEEVFYYYLLGGKVAMAKGQVARAIDYFERANQISDGSYSSAISLAHARLELGHLLGARLQAEIARKINPSSVEPEFIYADIERRTGKRQAALQRMKALTISWPNSEQAATAYARILSQVGQADQARAFLMRFVEMNPSAAEAIDWLGQLAYAAGDKNVALVFKRRAAILYSEQNKALQRDITLAWIESNDQISSDINGNASDGKFSESGSKVGSSNFPFPQNVKITGGSGFVVQQGKMVVTNWHVIDGGKEFAVKTALGEIIKARVVKALPLDDLALLELEKPLPPERAVANNDFVKPIVGRSVVVMGYPLWHVLGDSAPSLSNGIVSKVTGLKDDSGTFQITAKVNRGNSGGPVFDMTGNVVGVISGKLDSKRFQQEQGFIPEDVNFAIHVAKLSNAMDIQLNGIQTIRKEMSLEELYQQMLGKVVMVATYR
jgi:serine protease Do